VLGPLLFVVYTADLASIAEKPTTHNCIFTVVVSTWRQLLPNWNVALLMSAAGCQQTDNTDKT